MWRYFCEHFMTLCSETSLKLNYKRDMYRLKYNVAIDYCAIKKKKKKSQLSINYFTLCPLKYKNLLGSAVCVNLLTLSEISINTFGQYGNNNCTNNLLWNVCVKHNHLSDDFFGSQRQNTWCRVQRSPARMLSRLKAQSVS